MENSCLFIRGQVWYWEDPIYGRKENKMEVSIGEVTLRFNRYCIVAQTTETIDKSSVLVIPCSSSNHTPHDVPAPLAHVFHDNFTYARTRGIFPVHPKFLQRYICTLPETIMKQIEGELIKLLIPSIICNMSTEDVHKTLGIDLDRNSYDLIVPKDNHELEINIRSFIRDHLVKSDQRDIISAYELKDAFNQYCVIHNINIVDDIVEFLDVFTKVTNNSGYHFSDRQRYNLVEFRGLRIRGNLKLSINMSERDLINPSDPQRPGKWDDDSIIDFIRTYDRDGQNIAADKFGLKSSTAANYWYRWKDRLNTQKPPEVSVKIPPTSDIPKSVSKVSNMIRDSLIELDIYSWNSEYEASVDSHLSESTFYNNLGTCIYYSLLDFLSIRKDESNNFFAPNLNENSNYLSTWHFFDRVYHDRRISMTKDGLDMMTLYRKYFPDYNGIDPEWLNKLRSRIVNKLNMIDTGIDKICDSIRVLYCER